MNYKILLIFFISIVLFGCDQNINKTNKVDVNIKKKYSNTGFALIYDNNLEKIKVIDDRSLFIHHKFLKRKSSVKITNPKNGKSIIAEVKSNRQKFSDFYIAKIISGWTKIWNSKVIQNVHILEPVFAETFK